MNGQKSIEANFPTPTPDGNIDPDFNNKLNFTQKLILTSALIITAYQSCDENSQVPSVKETSQQNEKYSFWEAVKILWFGKSNNKNSKYESFQKFNCKWSLYLYLINIFC